MVKAPFEPGNFDKTWSARQTLQLRCGADLEDYFKGLDEWAIDYITEHAERLLKKPMTKEQVLAGYTSSLSQRGPNPTLLKTKINLEGPHACRFWASDGTQRGPPTDWRASEYTPSLPLADERPLRLGGRGHRPPRHRTRVRGQAQPIPIGEWPS